MYEASDPFPLPQESPAPPAGLSLFRPTKPFSTPDAVLPKPLPDTKQATMSRKDGRGSLNEPFNLQR
jgi:hypothetical protein